MFCIRFTSYLTKTVPHIKSQTSFRSFLVSLTLVQHAQMNQVFLELQVVNLRVWLAFCQSFFCQNLMHLVEFTQKLIYQVLIGHFHRLKCLTGCQVALQSSIRNLRLNLLNLRWFRVTLWLGYLIYFSAYSRYSCWLLTYLFFRLSYLRSLSWLRRLKSLHFLDFVLTRSCWKSLCILFDTFIPFTTSCNLRFRKLSLRWFVFFFWFLRLLSDRVLCFGLLLLSCSNLLFFLFKYFERLLVDFTLLDFRRFFKISRLFGSHLLHSSFLLESTLIF